jgi:nucleotide-binding universal stress UspA family protein
MSQATLQQRVKASSVAGRTTIEHILVPVDFGDPSLHALAYGKELAHKLGAALDVLCVVSLPYVLPVSDGGFQQLSAEMVEEAVRDAEKGVVDLLATMDRPARSRGIVRTGDPRAEILSYAAGQHADLIVMGTRGRTGPAHLMFGSVAEHVVRTASCPVLVVR